MGVTQTCDVLVSSVLAELRLECLAPCGAEVSFSTLSTDRAGKRRGQERMLTLNYLCSDLM